MGGTDTLLNISRVMGSNLNDTITGSSALQFEVFDGGAGDDIIDGGVITDTLNIENGNRVTIRTPRVRCRLTWARGRRPVRMVTIR